MEDYRKRLNSELLKNGHDVAIRFPDGYQEAPLAYDAVWAVALGKYGILHQDNSTSFFFIPTKIPTILHYLLFLVLIITYLILFFFY